MLRPLSLFIGARYTRAKRRNHYISFISLASMLGLALGVLAMIVVLSVMNGFQQEMRSRILGLLPHLVVSGVQPLADWPALAERLEARPGVLAAAPFAELDGMFSHRGNMQPVQVNGIDPAIEPRVSILAQSMRQGRLEDLRPGEFGVIIGELTARRFQLAIGDKLTLIVPELSASGAGISPRMLRLTVAGIFKVGAELDGSLALMHIADAASVLRLEPGQVPAVRLALQDLYQAPQQALELERLLGPGYRSQDWTRTQGSLFSAMQMEKTMIGLLLLLIIAVAAFNIIATLIMAVADKRTDIAILRTLGATPGQIMGIFMVQGSLIGCAGTLLGAGLGVWIASRISGWMAWFEQLTGNALFGGDLYFISSLPSQLQVRDVLLVCAAGLLLSFLATVYPSWKAARTRPAEALRH